MALTLPTPSDVLAKLAHCFALLEQRDVVVEKVVVGKALFDYLQKNPVCGGKTLWSADLKLDKMLSPWQVVITPAAYFDTAPMFNVVRRRVEMVKMRVDEDITKMPTPPPLPPMPPPPPPPVERSAMLVWDAEDPGQLMEAMTKFEEMLKKGYIAFTVDDNGRKQQKVDLSAKDKIKQVEEILFEKPMVV